MKTARLIEMLPGFKGVAALYEMYPTYEGNAYIVASSAVVWGEVECYLFASDSKGTIANSSELPGSQKGTASHVEVLGGIGYDIRT